MPGTRRALLALFSVLAAATMSGAAAAHPKPGTQPPPRRREPPPARIPRRPAAQREPRAAAARPPPIDRPGTAGGDLAPLPDRRYPTRAQAQEPLPRLIPGVPAGRDPTRGSSFLDRDPNPESLGRGRESAVPEPGVSLRLPFR